MQCLHVRISVCDCTAWKSKRSLIIEPSIRPVVAGDDAGLFNKLTMLKFSKRLLLSAGLCAVLASCGKSGDPAEETKENDPITGFFANEIKPPLNANCFQGAYYRKVVSSQDVWLGLEGKVVLPQIVFDESRKNPAKPQQYLDNPSVYMGGNMGGQETDIGLTWEVIRDEQGNVTADRRAFRPFLRRSAHVSGQAATYENAPAQKEYYWYPGEEVTMSVQIVQSGKIRFIVEGAGKRFERDFDCAAFVRGAKGDFKRVNAIDQVSNEGKPAQATKTRVEGAVWKETNLFRLQGTELVKVPVHQKRFTDMRCPSATNFKITASEAELKVGAESIAIDGGAK